MFSWTFFCVSPCFSISTANCNVCLHEMLCSEDFSHIQKLHAKFSYWDGIFFFFFAFWLSDHRFVLGISIRVLFSAYINFTTSATFAVLIKKNCRWNSMAIWKIHDPEIHNPAAPVNSLPSLGIKHDFFSSSCVFSFFWNIKTVYLM